MRTSIPALGAQIKESNAEGVNLKMKKTEREGILARKKRRFCGPRTLGVR